MLIDGMCFKCFEFGYFFSAIKGKKIHPPLSASAIFRKSKHTHTHLWIGSKRSSIFDGIGFDVSIKQRPFLAQNLLLPNHSFFESEFQILTSQCGRELLIYSSNSYRPPPCQLFYNKHKTERFKKVFYSPDSNEWWFIERTSSVLWYYFEFPYVMHVSYRARANWNPIEFSISLLLSRWLAAHFGCVCIYREMFSSLNIRLLSLALFFRSKKGSSLSVAPAFQYLDESKLPSSPWLAALSRIGWILIVSFHTNERLPPNVLTYEAKERKNSGRKLARKLFYAKISVPFEFRSG